jgi:formylmethanofuran dehydrogenase subunit E
MEALQSARSQDEELVAIVENDACGVDALQCVTGCTFGKGNLLFRDYGKHVYTLFSRTTHQAVRILFHPTNIPPGLREDRDAFLRWILTTPAENILSVTHISIEEPERARIKSSLTCALCGESVMESRTRELSGQIVCIPCFEQHRQG